MTIRYASVCSGIEAATVAWQPLRWSCAWLSEIEKFPSAVLDHHYPDTPNLGDMTQITRRICASYGSTDLLVGGTPCQSFSVAGLRKGLADPRGNLALVFLRLADWLRSRWLVWENVPGVLSSNGGRDFGAFLGALVKLGYGFAYRVLDAQFFGVAQRRKRVFVVGYLGDWRRSAAVLFEREGLRGHPPPSREAGPGVASHVIKGAAIGRKPDAGPQYGEILTDGTVYTLNCSEQHAVAAPTANGVGTCGAGDNQAQAGHLTVATLDASYARRQGCSGQDAKHGHSHLVPFGTTQLTSPGNYSNPKAGDPCHPLAMGAHAPAVAFDTKGTGALNTATDPNQNIVRRDMAVRRLTPRECERLQGFPDDHTLIPWRGKTADQCPDGPRYKALGNSMAVPVMRWIGERITQVEALEN